MKQLIFPFLIVTAVASVAGAQVDLRPVPFSQDPRAAFFPVMDAPVTTARAIGADGVKLVACEAALVTGTDGAHLEAECPERGEDMAPVVRLVSGGFLVRAGSRPVIVELGETARFEVRDAAVVALERKGSWIFQVKNYGDSGSVKSVIPAPREPASVETAEEEAPAPAEEVPAIEKVTAPSPVAQGKRFALGPDGVIVEASADQSKVLGDTVTALHPKRPARPPLVSVRVEDPADLKVRGKGGDQGIDDLEIEAVEVEVGCVEVCVD